jgi:hypothetical protein
MPNRWLAPSCSWGDHPKLTNTNTNTRHGHSARERQTAFAINGEKFTSKHDAFTTFAFVTATHKTFRE